MSSSRTPAFEHIKSAGHSETALETFALKLVRYGSLAFTASIFLLVLSSTTSSSLSWFTLHPLAQSLSVLLFSWGIAPLQPPSPSAAAERTRRFETHQSFALAGHAIFLLGSFSIAYNKYLRGAPHFTTWHGLLGIISVGLAFSQVAGGLASTWEKGKLVGGEVKGKKLYKYHRVGGYAFMTLFLFSAHLGGAHSLWATRQEGTMSLVLRVVANWIALPAVWTGLMLRLRPSKMNIF
ncbi:hypothetical protein BD324DRAFT_650038 [Kockovaella imperatae]|uniref:Cytochrome b561 domain-containing protein n=1 Tax=Kockovaella imperatae TaxID=4999 RepID=A0A1Y1UKW2_9TREE|nr:hypothetical protein BD324DRAFT_650038 [Kockovaella imperatae]ORX38693.1 hypothetical protein BD324DRAFT_650038 [Kockovaella imperatae]